MVVLLVLAVISIVALYVLPWYADAARPSYATTRPPVEPGISTRRRPRP